MGVGASRRNGRDGGGADAVEIEKGKAIYISRIWSTQNAYLRFVAKSLELNEVELGEYSVASKSTQNANF
jgi:hypothetical protein